jgi:hypothetical protein
MNKTIKINPYVLLVTGVICCVFAAVAMSTIVLAQTENPAPESTFEQRLAKSKTEQGVVLETKDSKRITSVCVSAQAKVRASQSGVTDTLNSRSETYERIDGQLWVVIGKLKLAGKDTDDLEKLRAEYAEKVDALTATGESYKQTLADIVSIGCKEDPEGFQALLLTGRASLTQFREQSADLKDLALSGIKPTLSDAAKDLQDEANNNVESDE